VLEARPEYAVLSSGGDVSVLTASSVGARLLLRAQADAALLAGANAVVSAGCFASVGAAASFVGAAAVTVKILRNAGGEFVRNSRSQSLADVDMLAGDLDSHGLRGRFRRPGVNLRISPQWPSCAGGQ
jgi:hypothetical protein